MAVLAFLTTISPSLSNGVMGKWFKRAAISALLLVGLLLTFYAVAWVRSEQALNAHYEVQDAPLYFAGDSAERDRGAHLYSVLGCADCHGAQGTGKLVFDAGPVGRMVAPNLTPTRLAERYDANGIAAAIRHGVGPDGRPLRFMPSEDFTHLSDADTAAIVRHLQSLPASDNQPGELVIGPLGRVLFLLGKFNLTPAALIDHQPRVRTAPAVAVSAEYGAYLDQVCTGCHGKDFAGQRVPGTPPELPESANLTPHATGLQGWTEADFIKVIRSGVRPDGRELNPFMPWRAYGDMTDDELRAIWLHLSGLPPLPGTGNG
jgi:cytochrome c553